MRTVRMFLASALAVGLLAVSADAATIIKPTGVTNDGTAFEFAPAMDGTEAIGGAGLSADLLTGDAIPGVLPTHQTPNTTLTVPTNVEDVSVRWTQANASGAVLTFDLGGLYDVQGVILWNFSEEWNGSFFNDRGLSSADVSFSTDGTTFGGAVTVSPTQAADVEQIAGQSFGLGSVNATHVRLSNLVNLGGDRTGFGEVRFTGDLVPEPASLALMGFGGLLMLRRRRVA